MFGRQKGTIMNSGLVFLGVCCLFVPASWVAEGLSDLRLCADLKCSGIISMGTAKINYSAGEQGMVSFKINSIIRVKSKSAGKDKKLWGIEVNGREGYAPKDFILETKVLVKDSELKHLVPVTIPSSQKKDSSNAPSSPAEALQPSENLATAKEEVELTTTTPLRQPIDGDKVVTVTYSDAGMSKDIPAQVTPVKPEDGTSDDTAIPVLEGVKTETLNMPSTGENDETSEPPLRGTEIHNIESGKSVAPPEANQTDKRNDLSMVAGDNSKYENEGGHEEEDVDIIQKSREEANKTNSKSEAGEEKKLVPKVHVETKDATNKPPQKETVNYNSESAASEVDSGSSKESVEPANQQQTDKKKALDTVPNESSKDEDEDVYQEGEEDKSDVRDVGVVQGGSEETNMYSKSKAGDEKAEVPKVLVETKDATRKPPQKETVNYNSESAASEVDSGSSKESLEPANQQQTDKRRALDTVANESSKDEDEDVYQEGEEEESDVRDVGVVQGSSEETNMYSKSESGEEKTEVHKVPVETEDATSKAPQKEIVSDNTESAEVDSNSPKESVETAEQQQKDKRKAFVTVANDSSKDEDGDGGQEGESDVREKEFKENNVEKTRHTVQNKIESKLVDTFSNSIQYGISNAEKNIKNEQDKDIGEFFTQPRINQNESERSNVNVEATTEPTVTEPGYLHHIDVHEEAFDTTTLPTVVLPATQSPETQVSGAPETAEISDPITILTTTNKEALHAVPNESMEGLKVPGDIQEVKWKIKTPTESTDANLTIPSPSPPLSAEITTDAKADVKTTNGEQNVPTLPIFQNSLQHEHQKHQHPHQHNQQYLHEYTDPQQHQHTQIGGITESSTDVTMTEEIEEKTEVTPIKHEDSNESLHMFSYPESAVGDTVVQSQPTANSDEAINNLASEETESDNFEAPTTSPTIDELKQHKNAAGAGLVQQTTPQPTPISSDAYPISTSPPLPDDVLDVEIKEKEQGLFVTILGTVNSFLSNGKKEDATVDDASIVDDELQRILFPKRVSYSKNSKENDDEFCEKLSPNDCPSRASRELNNAAASSSSIAGCQLDLNNMSMDMLLTVAGNKMLEMSQLLACLATVAFTCLFFLFVYYCFCNSSREGELLAKLNSLERSLLATHKENAILKEDLMGTRNKLLSIEDNSFGSNDMVRALKKELEDELLEKHQLQEQIGNLEKELENAAEAGLELNKIVSELLSNQTGDESIISSVEELQKQLNEQQKTILDINANLAEKSRENSELQLMIAEQNARLSGEIASLQQDNDELEAEKSNLQTRLEEVKREFEEDITKALESKNYEIKRLQTELIELSTTLEAEQTKYQTSLAKVEALEECLRTVRRDPSVNINQVIDVAHVRAESLDMQKRYASLKERLDAATDVKKLAEEQLQLACSENEKLKHDFHQSEKDKLEAQTRLEVLSNYFKEKETQLQKELSLKEAMWLKQQGETTSSVDRLTTMKDEIQSLKSQNDALRAEIEAQLAAHKAQTGTLENRAHETWLAARQSERRYEEARAEATALRRKLTSLAGAGGSATGEANFEKLVAAELNNAPSPIHMESPGSPLLGRLPPPPFLPPPFMGPPPPFLGMPPPFVPPGEMRPPPLGRLMSPPPGAGSGGSGGSGHLPPPRGGRYSLNRSGYVDYDDDDEEDYVDDDDEEEDQEEEERLRQRRRRRGSDINGSWHRDDSYSPPPRAYRSQSPTDSRYNYTAERALISTYDTETDLEPSPRKHDRRGTRGSRTDSYRDYSPLPISSSPLNAASNNNANKKQHSAAPFSKGHMSSGSEKSYNAPPQRHGGKKSGKSAV